MESQASRTEIIDLTGDEVAETEAAGGPGLAHCHQDRVEYGPSTMLTSQTAGPITRYVISSFTGFPPPPPPPWYKGLIYQALFAGPSHDFQS